MTSKTILDASAWIEYLTDSHFAKTIERYITTTSCITCSLTLAEVVAKTIKSGADSTIAITAIRTLSTLVAVDEALAVAAAPTYMLLREKKEKISLSDVILIALAQREDANIITKDSDFEGVKDAIVLK